MATKTVGSTVNTVAEGLSPQAKALLNMGKQEPETQPQVEQQTGVVVEKECVFVTFDSPKEDWSPLGHAQIQTTIPLAKVVDVWGEVLMVWQQARETFSELIEQHKAEENKATDAQVRLASDLASKLGIEFDFSALDKFEISKAIDDMQGKLKNPPAQAAAPVPQPAPKQWVGIQTQTPADTTPPTGGSGEWRSKPMSQKQRNKIIETANQRGIQLPANFLNFTSGEASDFMNQLWGKK